MYIDNLVEFIEEIVIKLYEDDLMGFKATLQDYLKNKFIAFKMDSQKRINLMKYLEESLKFKYISEIDQEIQK